MGVWNHCGEIIKRISSVYQTVRARRNARRLLGLKWNHSEYDLHESYRALVKKHHPALGGDVEDMRKLNEAFDILITKFRRPTSK
jgi:DnaJ-class molecular chaperone